ncbi:uncharacterized protein BDZ99DRAFT_129197 [Mytilinidion resinicola]|uniref:Uncharacterized protein n=1 Tax=Mytilinidion resinicola TaxID=574789 RepID=A0A6A6Z4Q7_9PEZI|nr:uncharacterized protein BDZ99DRAFT_129197 [Mytilinidion resinicola]KAF2816121.1 hypothetical protein BDZ99DRAFT_129197 [Mytilinidion resinicola]
MSDKRNMLQARSAMPSKYLPLLSFSLFSILCQCKRTNISVYDATQGTSRFRPRLGCIFHIMYLQTTYNIGQGSTATITLYFLDMISNGLYCALFHYCTCSQFQFTSGGGPRFFPSSIKKSQARRD